MMIGGDRVGWVAGLFEGEGTIVNHNEYSVAATIFMTDEDVLRRFHEVVGIGTLRGPYQDKRGSSRKPIWKWTVTKADDVVGFLTAIRPWMGERRTARIDEAVARLTTTRGRKSGPCARGHNDWRPDGPKRYCRTCASDAQRARRAREAALAANQLDLRRI